MILGRKGKLALGVSLLSLTAVGTTAAYLTSFDMKNNVMAVGHNTTEIQEDFPNPTPVPIEEDPHYQKSVWVSNEAVGEDGFNVDCYVRVSVGYSDYEIGRAVTLLNLDTANWFYNASDGYYYYINSLGEGERTTSLFSGFSIDSALINDTYLDKIPEFEIQIYEESVQAGDFANYQEAWGYYLQSI